MPQLLPHQVRHHPLIRGRAWIRLVLPVAAIAFFLTYRAFLTPDTLFFILLIVFFSYGLAWEFVKMFSPFVFLLLSYDSLRSLVPFVSKNVHYREMIDFDRWLGGGTLLTVHLQKLLFHGHLAVYDFYFYGLYMLHFVVPLLVGVYIWRTKPRYYWQFVWSLVVLSYAAFITFLAFPAAPPWLAAQNHVIPHIEKLSTDIWFAFGVHNFPTIYAKLNPNEVAAVPSLHSAYPLLVALFIWKIYGRKWGLISFIYPVSIWIGVVYMGEHYFFDVVAGAIYAVAAYLTVPRILRAWHKWRGKGSTDIAHPDKTLPDPAS